MVLRRWALKTCLVLLVLLLAGWMVSMVRPMVFRVYGLGQRGADGTYNLGIEIGCYSSGFGVNVDRIGHTATWWVALQDYRQARHGVHWDNWRWWPQVRRIGGPLGIWTEVFLPFWVLVLLVGAMAAWLRWWRRYGRGCCQSCGYDLQGVTGVCPECGTTR
jgi:hypothetical protein